MHFKVKVINMRESNKEKVIFFFFNELFIIKEFEHGIQVTV